MKIASTHYSMALNAASLTAWAESKAVALHEYKKTHPNILLCYSGMSGVAHATALALAYERLSPFSPVSMAYARKKGEISHGFEVERAISQEALDNGLPFTLVFVDDFVASGETFKFTKTAVQTYMQGMPGFPGFTHDVGAVLSSDWDGDRGFYSIRLGFTAL